MKYLIKLDQKQLETVMQALNECCKGIEAAKLILPLFLEIERQIKEVESTGKEE